MAKPNGPLLFLSGAVAGVASMALANLFAGPSPKQERFDEEEAEDVGSLLQIKCTASRGSGGFIGSSGGSAAPPRFCAPFRDPAFARTLTELDLGGCGLVTLPMDFGTHMSSLRKLNAAKNELSWLPPSFASLRELRIAFFLGCAFETVPSVLGQLPKLFMLSFKANKLRSVPEDALAPSIGWLILSDNQLPSLPTSIGRLAGLRKCMLAGNQLTELPAEMGRCRDLELIRLADNRLREMPTALLRLPRLAWIALASNEFNAPIAARARADVPECAGTVKVATDRVLGSGASGIVFEGTLVRRAVGAAAAAAAAAAEAEEQEEERVAVKLFRDAKTSDGDPADEMAAAAVAGAGNSQFAGCASIVRSYGRLPATAASEAAAALAAASSASSSPSSSSSSSSVGSMGLVLQLLDGWQALAGPPSFASVTRDVYAGDAGKPVHPTSGECAAAPVYTQGGGVDGDALVAAVGILRDVASAAATLHARGLSHGDLYGHNILLPPHDKQQQQQKLSAAGGAAGAAGAAETLPSAVLSDFGASFFYKAAPGDDAGVSARLSSSSSSSSAGAVLPSSSRDASPEHLLERLEVLAFGHLAAELLERLPPQTDEGAGATSAATAAAATSAVAALRSLAADCRGAEVWRRPSFRSIEGRIRTASTGLC